jgi:hypothetical protein
MGERLMARALNAPKPLIGELVDDLGRTRARIGELEKTEKILKETITARGVTEAEGAI